MADTLIEAVRRARIWPSGSGARATLAKVARKMAAKRIHDIEEARELLNRQWAWLERNGTPGVDDDNSDRYEDGVRRFMATLADYEDLCDGLEAAREELKRLAA